jgi:hypothetical protein
MYGIPIGYTPVQVHVTRNIFGVGWLVGSAGDFIQRDLLGPFDVRMDCAAACSRGVDIKFNGGQAVADERAVFERARTVRASASRAHQRDVEQLIVLVRESGGPVITAEQAAAALADAQNDVSLAWAAWSSLPPAAAAAIPEGIPPAPPPGAAPQRRPQPQGPPPAAAPPPYGGHHHSMTARAAAGGAGAAAPAAHQPASQPPAYAASAPAGAVAAAAANRRGGGGGGSGSAVEEVAAQAMVAELMGMGFPEAEVLAMLSFTGFNKKQAIDMLLA